MLLRLTGPHLSLWPPALSWKVLFLVAITLACGVSEIRALALELPYTACYKDNIQLRPHPAFLPKIVSQFHTSQDIYLPVFFPKPHASDEERRLHALDIRRSLAFYTDRAKLFCKST